MVVKGPPGTCVLVVPFLEDNMYTLSGCQMSLGQAGQDSPSFTDVEYRSLVQYLWNKYKNYAIVPDIPGLPEINLGSIIPGETIENIIVAYFIDETEKMIKSVTDIRDTVRVSNLSKTLATFAVNELRNFLVDAIGQAEASAISKMTITDLLDNIGDFINPLKAAFVCLDEAGPSMGSIRKSIISDIAGKLQSEIVDFVRETWPDYTMPVEESEMTIFDRNARAKAAELARSKPITNMEQSFAVLQPVYMTWLEANRPQMMFRTVADFYKMWPSIKMQYVAIFAQELQKALEEQITEPQKHMAFLPKIKQPAVMAKPAMLLTAIKRPPPGAMSSYMLPLLAGGAAIFFLMKKK